ncbi:putative MFS family arabinose efflux permease [Luteococcus japonicus]|uniref:Putative MFS family arabinose efflux permease n=1 Tax=Luteococcus japonicus TaxID=33984 RepID=A0A3N1ZT19_9ACTN|nr:MULTISPECIES: MFS transporter [Luteococcus]MDN5562171.1 MFS transporter [Luteococcus sp.]ROR54011.1 putative MFS family arabinose efflux permease [Luteococcus japonicus]
MSQTFSSLANPNYRTWFLGGLVSNVGGWMARTAQAWLVLVVLTDGNAQALGYQTALIFLPGLLLSPVAGTVADRFNKRHILLASSTLGMLSALVLSTLTITGHVRLWHVFTLSLVDGLAMAFDNPARQAFVSEVVPFEHLPNAISLNSASFNAARLLGPGIGGALIAWVGTGWVIAANVVAFAAMITALLSMDAALLHPAKPTSGKGGGFVAGLKYVRRRPDLMALLTVGLAVGGLGFNYNISNAVMATEAFHRGAGDYGIIGSFMGIGALVAALWSARRGSPRLRHVLMGMVGYCVFNLASALSGNFWLFVLLQIPVGFFTITALVTGNSLLQTATTPQMRGRVMALWGLTIMGMAPMISPLVGWIGDRFGPRSTILFGVIAVSIMFALLTATIMRHDRIRVRLDWHKRAPWMRIERLISQDVSEVRR